MRSLALSCTGLRCTRPDPVLEGSHRHGQIRYLARRAVLPSSSSEPPDNRVRSTKDKSSEGYHPQCGLSVYLTHSPRHSIRIRRYLDSWAPVSAQVRACSYCRVVEKGSNKAISRNSHGVAGSFWPPSDDGLGGASGARSNVVAMFASHPRR